MLRAFFGQFYTNKYKFRKTVFYIRTSGFVNRLNTQIIVVFLCIIHIKFPKFICLKLWGFLNFKQAIYNELFKTLFKTLKKACFFGVLL